MRQKLLKVYSFNQANFVKLKICYTTTKNNHSQFLKNAYDAKLVMCKQTQR